MKSLWRKVGVIAYWAMRPVIRFVLRRTMRTRVLVRCGDEVLVVRNWLSDGKWGLPGGGVKHGEMPEVSLVRELFEETGVRLRPEQLQQLFTGTVQSGGMGFAYHCFAAQLPAKPTLRIHRSLEITHVAWLPKRQLTAATAHPDVLLALATQSKRNSRL